MTWTVVSNTTFAGPVSAGAAGSTLQNGWIDLSGNSYSVNSSNFLSCVAQTDSAPWNTRQLIRPASEAAVDCQVVMDFILGPANNNNNNIWILFRSNRSTSAATGYIVSFNSNDGSTFQSVYFPLVSGTLGTQHVGSSVSGLTAGTEYTLTASVVQTNSTTTTVSWQLNATPANGGALLASGTFTDTTSALQNISGSPGLFVFDSTGGNQIGRVVTYTDVSSANAYTLSGPSSGQNGVASSNFTVTPNGSLSSSTVVTPSDGGAGGTFTPATVTFPASSSASQTFTYTPATTGSITVSTSNNGGLTNPSSLTYQSYNLTTLGVTSGAAKFSPGNWKGDTGRGGSVYRQSWNNGAWFSYTWNASSSPIATILIGSASSGSSNKVSYYLNGVLTDNVSANANISISGITPNATNTLVVYLRNSTQSGRWNNGANVVQVTGLQVDSGSSAGVAPAAQPWGIIIGDSIAEGIQANAGSDCEIYDYTFLMMKALEQLGYDSGISACGYSGWLRPGDSGGDVPAYYSISGSSGGSGGTYSDSASRWNKIDQGVSLLDANNQISSYGQTGTTPAFIFINYMTNECLSGSNTSDAQASVTQALTALRAAAPNATIVLMVPFTLNAITSASYATYIAALTAGVAAYKAANPSDSKVTLVNLGATVAATLTQAGLYGAGGVHPYAPGHAYVAPMATAALVKALTPSVNRWTHS